MARVLLDRVVKRYGAVVALDTLTLEVQEGEFLTLLGPSGCGKTTTLRIIAGFIDPTEGRILLGNEDVTLIPPQKRAIGMVFQDYALFPHLTIAENIGFGLKQRGVAKEQIAKRVAELLDLVRLPSVAERYPSEISGGQQQRIALARAVAYPPRVLLMDEPLGALDLKLREAMQIELRRIQQQLNITTVYVTHDQTEAISMSDRIAVMNLGKLEQLGMPREIYDMPRTKFVADFVGKINLISGRIVGRDGGRLVVETSAKRLFAAADGRADVNGEVALGIRPENLHLIADGMAVDGLNVIDGRIASQTFAGSRLHVQVQVNDDITVLIEEKPGARVGAVGTPIRIGWSPEDSIVLPG